jgi:hypothetical protein
MLADAPAAVADNSSAPLEYRPPGPVPADLRHLNLGDEV